MRAHSAASLRVILTSIYAPVSSLLCMVDFAEYDLFVQVWD